MRAVMLPCMKAKKTTRKAKTPAKRKAKTSRLRYRTPAEWIGPGSEEAPAYVKAIIIEEKDNQARVDDAARKARHILDDLSMTACEPGAEEAVGGLISLYRLARDGGNADACSALIQLFQLIELIEEWMYGIAMKPPAGIDGDFDQHARMVAGTLLAAHYKRVAQDVEAGRKASKKSHRSKSYKLTHGVKGAPRNEGFAMNIRRPNLYAAVRSPFARWCFQQLCSLDHAIRHGGDLPFTTKYPAKLFGKGADKSESWDYSRSTLMKFFPRWTGREDWQREQSPGAPPATWRNYENTARAVFEILWTEDADIRKHIAEHGY